MDVELHKRLIANSGEAVHLARLDHEYVPGARLERLTFHRPSAAPSLNELNLVVRVAVRPRAAAGLATEQKHGGAHIAMVSAHEAVCASTVGQLVLSESKHVWPLLAMRRNTGKIAPRQSVRQAPRSCPPTIAKPGRIVLVFTRSA